MVSHQALTLKEERERGNGPILLFSFGTLLFTLLVQILQKGEFDHQSEIGVP